MLDKEQRKHLAEKGFAMNSKVFFLFSLLSLPGFGAEVSIQFEARTNLPGVIIEGNLERPYQFIAKEDQAFEIPLKNLKTGMDLRDEHMYQEIFAGKNPGFKFSGLANCLETKPCVFKTTLRIQAREKVFEIPLERKKNQLRGEFEVKLSDFDIKAPEKFGVRVLDQVRIKIHGHL